MTSDITITLPEPPKPPLSKEEIVARLTMLRNFFAGVPPEKVKMSSTGEGFNPNGKNEEYSCLTAGCLWGWAMVYEPFREMGIPDPNRDGANLTYVEDFSDFFGVNYNEANRLTTPACYWVDMCIKATKESGGKYNTPGMGWKDRIPKEMVLKHLDAVISEYQPA